MSEASVREALTKVKYPGFSRDIISFGLVRNVVVEDGVAKVSLALTTSDPKVPEALRQEVIREVGEVRGIRSVEVNVIVRKNTTSSDGASEPAASTDAGGMQQVRSAVAIASGKGGVGKSTFAVNLAAACASLQGKALRIGLMDCDIYGPSVPLMLGIHGQPEIEDEMILPLENFGVRAISMGLLVDETTPVVWRGPMVMKTIQQFAQNVNWGELDLLFVDLPPGTGDAQLSLVQTIPLEGALIVTTPQRAAVSVARRGALMFGKVHVPLLGVAENMSYLEGPDGDRQYLFGKGGGEGAAEALETDFLGQIPLDGRIREGGDNGIPIVVSHPECEASKAFFKMAERVLEKLNNS